MPVRPHRGILYDMSIRINPLEVDIQACHEDDDLDIEALWRGRRIGHVSCMIDDQRLNLCDITVNDEVFVPFPFAHNFLIFLGVPCRRANARGLHVGSRLMARLIKEAKSMGIVEIWGSVTDGDANARPFLLDWYRRSGFVVGPADKECIDTAKWKVTLRLGRNISPN